MLLLLKRSCSLQNSAVHAALRSYSAMPKKAAGRFTSNKLITQPVKGHVNEVQQTLVYIGMRIALFLSFVATITPY